MSSSSSSSSPFAGRVISVKKDNLRSLGYDSLRDWLKEPSHIYIGRDVTYVDGAKQSKWHNPFKTTKYTPVQCLTMYKKMVESNKELMKALPELKGKTLGCWCRGKGEANNPNVLCHGDILYQMVQKLEKLDSEEEKLLAKDTSEDNKTFDSSSSTKSTFNLKTDPRADEYIVEAEKILKTSRFSSLFSGGNKNEEAVELYIKAAAVYKMNKNWNEAGEAYIKAAELYNGPLKNSLETCSKYVDAAKSLRQVDSLKSISYYTKAVQIHMEENRFSSASKLWKEIGELHENATSYDKAEKAYRTAADCYEAEDQTANATSMHIKVAQLAACQEKYEEAIIIYEKIADISLQSSTRKWSVKNYYMNSLLCWLAVGARKGSMTQVRKKIGEYKDKYPQLDGTREVKLVEQVAEKFDEEDVEGFTEVVFDYDSVLKLDNWSATVLMEVKSILKKGARKADEEEEEAVPT